VTSRGPLTLESTDVDVWVNRTGMSTRVLLDLCCLYACVKASTTAQPTSLDLRDLKIIAGSHAKVSVRLKLCLQTSTSLRTVWCCPRARIDLLVSAASHVKFIILTVAAPVAG
jgi:hypothetical protein